MKQTNNEKIFQYFNYMLLVLIGLATIYPLFYVLVASISNPDAVKSGEVLLFPKGLNWSAYEKVLNEKGIWIAYANTVYYTVVGTAFSMVITALGAYPLSKKRLMGRKVIAFMIALTMWFKAGMIPLYLTLKSLSLLDNRAAMILAFACTAFYVFLLRTYFESIPDSLEESAKIDGANDWIILWKIYLPLSLPALMTIALYYAIEKWNGYFWAMIILKDENKIPLQVLLKKLVVQMSPSEQISVGNMDFVQYSEETVTYATIVVSVLPMLFLYPYIQKYFVKGIMVGSVKE